MVKQNEKRIAILLFLMMVFFLVFSFAWNNVRKYHNYFLAGYSYMEGILLMLICAFSIFLLLLLIKDEN